MLLLAGSIEFGGKLLTESDSIDHNAAIEHTHTSYTTQLSIRIALNTQPDSTRSHSLGSSNDGASTSREFEF